MAQLAEATVAEHAAEPEVTPAAALPAAVTEFGVVELELMGHRLRIGQCSEVVIAGQPFLRLVIKGGRTEYYRPDAVYCLTPVPDAPAPATPSRLQLTSGWPGGSDDYDNEDGPF
jgi:hypothetical protein